MDYLMIKRKVFKNGRNVLLQFIQYIHLAILQCHGKHAFATCKDITTPKNFGNIYLNLCLSSYWIVYEKFSQVSIVPSLFIKSSVKLNQ